MLPALGMGAVATVVVYIGLVVAGMPVILAFAVAIFLGGAGAAGAALTLRLMRQSWARA